MAVTLVKELTRKGTDSVDPDKGYAREHTITYRVQTDDVATEAETILADTRLPPLGSFYQSPEGVTNNFIRCIERIPAQEDDAGLVWTVEVKFSSNYLPTSRNDPDPRNHPATFTTDTEERQEAFQNDIEGTWLRNSANEAYDPPAQRDAGDCIITVEKNMPFDFDEAQLIKDFKHTVNAETFRGHPPGTAKLSRIRVEEVYSGVDYKKVTAIFKVRYGKRIRVSESWVAGQRKFWREQFLLTDLPEVPNVWEWQGWDTLVLDAGFSTLVGGATTPIRRDGARPTKPALLDGTGTETTTAIVYHRYKAYKSTSFSTIGLGI